MPGAKYRSIKKPNTYEALRRKGYSKSRAAAISNAQYNKMHGRGGRHRTMHRRRR